MYTLRDVYILCNGSELLCCPDSLGYNNAIREEMVSWLNGGPRPIIKNQYIQKEINRLADCYSDMMKVQFYHYEREPGESIRNRMDSGRTWKVLL
jgi:hypothetical protein